MTATAILNDRGRTRLGVLLTVMALAGCSDSTTEPSIGGLSVVRAAPLMGVPGWILRDTLEVRAVTTGGAPRSGALVTWTVTVGGGSIAPVLDTTDADGLAKAIWTLGPQGGPNQVMVSASQGFTVTLSTVAEALKVDQVAATASFGCGLVNGEVWCWGKDAWTSTEPVSLRPITGQAWVTTAPGRIVGATGFTTLAVGTGSVCALNPAGEVWCATSLAPALAQRADLPPLRQIVGVQSYGAHYCGLAMPDSTAWCWTPSAVAAQIAGSPAFVDLDIDGSQGAPSLGFLACGTLADSTAACWGDGSLGDGSATASATPVVVSGGHHFAELAVGEMFACGRLSDGKVYCWGKNDWEQFGPPGPDAATPILVDSSITRITASEGTVLARKAGTIVYWGGYGGVTPGPVASLAGLDVVGFASHSTDCVLLSDGQVYCVDEMWDQSSIRAIQAYAPVHPVVARVP